MNDENKMVKEYKEFMATTESKLPPFELSEKIRNTVMSDLNPSWASVMLKLLFIHLFMSSLTLTICPQFGIGPIGGGLGMLRIVESYGHLACGAFCGGLFFSGSVLMSALVFSPAQKRKIYQSAVASFSLLAIISLGTLILFSNMLKGTAPHLHLEFLAAWLLSGIVLSILISKLTMQTRTVVETV